MGESGKKKLKDQQTRNVSRLLNMVDSMGDDEYAVFGVSNAYETLEMMVDFDEGGGAGQSWGLR